MSDAKARHGGGTLRPRLVALAVIPTLVTLAVIVLFVFLLRDASGVPRTNAAFWVGSGALVGACVLWQWWWARRLSAEIVGPVTELADKFRHRDGRRVHGSASRRPRWEIRTALHRADRLLAETAELEAERARLQITVAKAVSSIDRVGVRESGGDAAELTGLLAPLGESLRALMERLDRRDVELNTLFEQLGHAVTTLGEDVRSASRADEGAFMSALSRVAALRALRANLEAIAREARRADGGAAGDRVAAMLARSSAQLDQVLSELGSESAEREARSRAWRRLAERGAGLEAEIAGVRRRVGDRVAPSPSGE